MKRIAIAIATTISALSLAGLTTFAAWTDTVTVTNNIIQTGTADLDVSTDGGLTYFDSTAGSTMVLSGLVPGAAATEAYSFSLINNSSAGVTFDLTGQITSSVIVPTAGVDKSQLMIEIYNTTTAGTEVAEMSLTAWEAGATAFTTTLPSGSARHYGVRARLLGTALNEWQGQTVTYTMTVIGTSI